MKPKRIDNQHDDLFRERLSVQLDPRNPLLQLAKQIEWQRFEESLSEHHTSNKGQPPKPIRLMVGLLMLQHIYQLSDEQIIDQWRQNPYWQCFCGYDHFQWETPVDATSLVRFRQRIGQEGMEQILAVTIEIAVQTKTVKKKDLQQVIVDTTVMEKNITYPTDSKLLNRAREKLVKLAKKAGIKLRQTYQRVGKELQIQTGRYAHAKQYKRMKATLKKLKTILGRTVRDVQRKIQNKSEDLKNSFESLLKMSQRLIEQEVESANKLYSLHEPQTYCISKGKAHKRYEYGCKVSLVITHKQGLVLSSQALETNAFDGHTLQPSLTHAERLTASTITKAFVDKGYKGHGITDKQIYISGQKRGMTAALKRQLKRRSAIEPHIGHMKADGKLQRNMLKGSVGDMINAVLCGVGHNLRLVLNHISSFLTQIWQLLFWLYLPDGVQV